MKIHKFVLPPDYVDLDLSQNLIVYSFCQAPPSLKQLFRYLRETFVHKAIVTGSTYILRF